MKLTKLLIISICIGLLSACSSGGSSSGNGGGGNNGTVATAASTGDITTDCGNTTCTLAKLQWTIPTGKKVDSVTAEIINSNNIKVATLAANDVQGQTSGFFNLSNQGVNGVMLGSRKLSYTVKLTTTEQGKSPKTTSNTLLEASSVAKH